MKWILQIHEEGYFPKQVNVTGLLSKFFHLALSSLDYIVENMVSLGVNYQLIKGAVHEESNNIFPNTCVGFVQY